MKFQKFKEKLTVPLFFPRINFPLTILEGLGPEGSGASFSTPCPTSRPKNSSVGAELSQCLSLLCLLALCDSSIRDRRGTPKNLCDEVFAEHSGEFSGAICLTNLFLLGSA